VSGYLPPDICSPSPDTNPQKNTIPDLSPDKWVRVRIRVRGHLSGGQMFEMVFSGGVEKKVSGGQT